MQCISAIRKKIILIALSIPAAAAVMAQDASKAAEKTVASSNNQLAMLLAIMTAILAFVIWGMGRVLVELGSQLVEKDKREKKQAINTPVLTMVIGLLLLTQFSFAQNTPAVAEHVVANYGGLSETAFEVFITVIGIEVITILFLAFSIKRMYVELLPEKPKRIREASAASAWWKNLDKKLFTRAIPVEKEADVMLDHDYDGIRELDNSLPPWWKYGFYITIAVALIYLLNFHVLGIGKNPEQEYAAEMEQARIEKEIYESKNKDKVDEEHVPMADAAGIGAGQEMFEANCVACHLKGGAGNVGPNLTDNYWLHKGSLNDIYKTIKNGYPDKGMQSWSSKFNDKEISLLASYIKTLRGTNPVGAKAAQGELYEEVKPTTDSIKTTRADSTAQVK